MTKSKLKLISATELVADKSHGVTKQTKYYELGGKKFRINFEVSNGCPMGFNSKKCLSQYDSVNAKWNYLEDIKVLSMSIKTGNYYDVDQAKLEMAEFFTKMEKHLTTIYS